MKIAVSATGTDLSATIDQRFGRCRHYLLVETDDLHVEAIDNPNADLTSSAGIQSAALMANAGVKLVITGNCGPKAMQVFDAAGIRVVSGQRGVIREAIEKVRGGVFDESTSGNPQPINTPPARVAPRGAGRGCGGRGLGGGRGMGVGRRCMPAGGGNRSSRQQAQLQQEADRLKQQLAEVQARLKQLT